MKKFMRGIRRFIKHVMSFFSEPKYPHVHPTAQIEDYVKIYNPSNIYMDEKTSIGSSSVIMNTRAKFIMKRWSFCAQELLVITGNHMSVIGVPLIGVSDNMKDELDVNREYDRAVVVNEDVWLGARVTLCSGVQIGRGAVLATGAVATKSVPPYAIWGGVPAKHIKFKWSIEQILEHESKLYHENERLSKIYLENIFKEYNNDKTS